MSLEDFLTLLFDVIALSFFAIATLDFFTGLMQLWLRSTVPLDQQCLFDEKPGLEFHLEPEPVTEPRAPAVEPEPTKKVEAVPPELEILQDVDIDNLQLRSARKIARTLNIAQKVNGKDQPLSWLRAQIKANLQQPQELPPAAIDAVRELLAS